MDEKSLSIVPSPTKTSRITTCTDFARSCWARDRWRAAHLRIVRSYDSLLIRQGYSENTHRDTVATQRGLARWGTVWQGRSSSRRSYNGFMVKGMRRYCLLNSCDNIEDADQRSLHENLETVCDFGYGIASKCRLTCLLLWRRERCAWEPCRIIL